jgi:hypothetical protein
VILELLVEAGTQATGVKITGYLFTFHPSFLKLKHILHHDSVPFHSGDLSDLDNFAAAVSDAGLLDN